MTTQEINIECVKIQSFLEITVSEQTAELVERGNTLVVYLARTSYLLAEAKNLYLQKINSDLMKQLNKQLAEVPVLTSKAINLISDSVAREEKYSVNWLDRLNSTVTHQLDWLRTLISKAKSEMYQNRNFNQ